MKVMERSSSELDKTIASFPKDLSFQYRLNACDCVGPDLADRRFFRPMLYFHTTHFLSIGRQGPSLCKTVISIESHQDPNAYAAAN